MESYLLTDVVHPHGMQYVPRSLLFGVDAAEESAGKLAKPYWAQNDTKFGDLFPETDLFIIFGCSLGESDGWWWRNIVDRLTRSEPCDAIIYWRMTPSQLLLEGDVRDKLQLAAGHGGDEVACPQ